MSKMLLVGKPNCGKSLLFDQLTGLRQKVANYPGVTVELKRGQLEDIELIDFPGTYSLTGLTKDETVAVTALEEYMRDDAVELIINVLDGTRLERSLVMALQVQNLAQKHNKRVAYVLNFVDELRKHGHQIDVAQLAQQLNAPVYPLSARYLEGVGELRSALLAKEFNNFVYQPAEAIDNPLLLSQQIAANFGMQKGILLERQNRIDDFLLNNAFGGVVFFAIMFFLFQSIFTWAGPLMDGVEMLIGRLGELVISGLPEGIVSDFVADALFGGVGSFLVFVPQIMVLTLIIGLLEDSGYLARAALICHKPLSAFGLSGRSFIPYLSGHACAIPAIMAARTIESPRKRLFTMMTIPLMSCSARLPVYALLIAVFIPAEGSLWGVFNLQGAAFFGLYLFGILMALLVAFMLERFSKAKADQPEMPFLLELPSYRLPHWKPLMQRTLTSASQFIRRAAPVIFCVSVGLWVLGYFPMGASLEDSWLGMIGHVIEPVFAPLGVDWRYGVAILMSFLAREVFVGALGTLYGMSDADENIEGLASQIMADGLPLGTGIGLLLFYVIALQCVATVATLRAETGSSKIAWGVYAGYGVLAYVIAVIAANII